MSGRPLLSPKKYFSVATILFCAEVKKLEAGRASLFARYVSGSRSLSLRVMLLTDTALVFTRCPLARRNVRDHLHFSYDDLLTVLPNLLHTKEIIANAANLRSQIHISCWSKRDGM